MFFTRKESLNNFAAIDWQHEVLHDYIMNSIDCTVEQADQLIALRTQPEANTEMMECVQEQRRLDFVRYLVKHKYLREDLLAE